MPTSYESHTRNATVGAEQFLVNSDGSRSQVVATKVSISVQPGDCKVDAATNAAAAITLADPGSGVSNVIGAVYWSYNNTPTAGKLTIADNGTTVFEVDITAAGPGFFEFPEPLKFTVHTATVITLAAGGSGVTGKITARRWTE